MGLLIVVGYAAVARLSLVAAERSDLLQLVSTTSCLAIMATLPLLG